MANRYWVISGGTGTGLWNPTNTNNWSATSGGAGGASVPTSADNVFFDANSFNGAAQSVSIQNGTGNCLSMDWTGVTNNPLLTGGSTLNIAGNLTLSAAMTSTHNASFVFNATSPGKTITTNGVSLNNNFSFNGGGGGWTLQDALTIGGAITQGGSNTLDFNGKAVSCGDFTISGVSTGTFTFGTSVITCSGNVTFGSAGVTLIPGTSNIVMTGATKTFAGFGLTFNNVTFSGTPTNITGSNTFNILTLNKGKVLNLTSGTTQTVASLVCNGTTASPSTLQAVTATSAATIALPAARHFIRHTSIKDITVTGATTTTSIAGTNVSGNTGITFVTKFELGRIKNDGSFNWYSAATGTVDKVSG